MCTAYDHDLGNYFYIDKDFSGGFSTDRIFVFPFCHGLTDVVDHFPTQTDWYESQTGTYLCCARILRNLPVLSFGKYRAYLYNGFKCGSDHFSRSIFYGHFEPSVSERRRTITGKVLWWICSCNGRDLSDQL